MSEAQSQSEKPPMVTATIDGQEVTVPKGTNIIEAAKSVEVEIPFYCYHPHLSVPGNCRICQVEVEGAPKLMIGCHTQLTDGMVVKTHKTSELVQKTQASTMELLLINHPLDCTVCDQAGHCKLQDYHFEYNAKPSRFLEYKQNKPKAVPLGSTVMLDGERCIACTRCVRFCDEVTETGEIGLMNRGDRYLISVKEGKELENPLSGTVVDLCPVGALTHRDWRFNTRIWYANPTDSVCTGCSTGCNAKVFERDGQVVQVKARLNSAVNKEWLCDEGRYGFDRFLPRERVLTSSVKGEATSWEEALAKVTPLKNGKTLLLLAPDLTVEEYSLVEAFRERCLQEDSQAVVAYRSRELSRVEEILVSPDYAPNFQGAYFSQERLRPNGAVCESAHREEREQAYENALREVKENTFDNIVFVGDRAVCDQDLADMELLQAISRTPFTLGMLCDREGALYENCTVVLPARSILEKSGLFLNGKFRLQYVDRVVPLAEGAFQHWKIFGEIAASFGKPIVDARSDRDLTLSYLGAEPRVAGITIRQVKNGGIDLLTYVPAQEGESGESSNVEVSKSSE
ncbi:2Fe-2S iron-sulfur cluster-binding protein [bacterium]|nr:2Fe-2S iron-sulfur cluster-binding protein [bacterium]